MTWHMEDILKAWNMEDIGKDWLIGSAVDKFYTRFMDQEFYQLGKNLSSIFSFLSSKLQPISFPFWNSLQIRFIIKNGANRFCIINCHASQNTNSNLNFARFFDIWLMWIPYLEGKMTDASNSPVVFNFPSSCKSLKLSELYSTRRRSDNNQLNTNLSVLLRKPKSTLKN